MWSAYNTPSTKNHNHSFARGNARLYIKFMLCSLCSCDNHSQLKSRHVPASVLPFFATSSIGQPALLLVGVRTRAPLSSEKKLAGRYESLKSIFPRQTRRQPLLFCDWWMFVFLLPCEPNAQEREGSVLCSTLCQRRAKAQKSSWS